MMKHLALAVVLAIGAGLTGCARQETETGRAYEEGKIEEQTVQAPVTMEERTAVPATETAGAYSTREQDTQEQASTPVPASTNDTMAGNTEMAEGTQGLKDEAITTEDREIVREIRRSVDKDRNLTGLAKNVKISADEGRVTLSGGPVNSDMEKMNFGRKAAQVVGTENVTNDITVRQ